MTQDSATVTRARPDTLRSAPATAAPAPAHIDSTRSDYGGLTPEEAAILTVPSGPRRVLPPPGRFDQPHWVMLRSLALPGWGQMHNGSWLKMGLIGGADAYMRVRVIHDQRELTDLSRTVDQKYAEMNEALANGDSLQAAAANQAYNTAVFAYNTLLDKALNRRWLLATVVLYSMIDAYVDAHFRNFDTSIEIEPRSRGGGGPGARFQLRWSF